MNKVILQLSLMMILSISFSFAQNIQLTDNADLGSILTDSEGKTLYYFTKDADLEMSACNGGCLDKWPIFYTADLSVSAGLSTSDFSSYERADGSMQMSYKGWPLYYFGADATRGETKVFPFLNLGFGRSCKRYGRSLDNCGHRV